MPIAVVQRLEEVHLVMRVIRREPVRVLGRIGSLRRGLTIADRAREGVGPDLGETGAWVMAEQLDHESPVAWRTM